MTPIEIIALIFIIVAVVKMLFLLINPKVWMNGTMSLFGKKISAQLIGFILAGIIFYYLRQAEISIVEILAVSSFAFAMMIIALAGHIDDFVVKYKGLIKRGKLWEEYWLYSLIWIILLILGVKELFF